MARIDFDQALSKRIVQVVLELLVPGRTLGSIETPSRSVRDHHRVKAPVVEFVEEASGSHRRLATINGKVAHGNAVRAMHRVTQDVEVTDQVEGVAVGTHQCEHPHGKRTRKCCVGLSVESVEGSARRDGSHRDVTVFEAAENDVLVAVVVVGVGPHLGPFPTQVSGDVGVRRVARNFVALANCFDGFIPGALVEADRVVVDGPKVEGRTMTREVAGVGNGVSAFTAGSRERHHEGIQAERTMNVEVAEENLLGTRDPDVERGFFLHMRSLGNDFGRQCNGRGRARPPMRPQPAPAQPLDDQEGDEEKGNEDDDEFLHTRLRALALFWLGARLTNRAAPSLASIDPFHRHTADCARYVV